MARVVACVEVARHVARGIESFNNLAVLVQHLGVAVDGEAAHRGKDDAVRDQGIVRLTRERLVVARVTVVVGVALQAVLEEAVVARHRFLKGGGVDARLRR